MPSLGSLRPKGGLSLPSVDRWLLFMITAWIVGPLFTAWLFFGVRNRVSDLEIAIESARCGPSRR